MANASSAIKYWLLTTEYPPFHGGGIGTYAFLTAQMLIKKGYELTLFVQDSGVQDYVITKEKGVDVVRFNEYRTKEDVSLGYAARLSYEFAQIVKEMIPIKGKPDLIEAQDYLGIAYYLLQYKYTLDQSVANIPVLITLHSPAFLYLEYNRVSTYKFPDFWTCEMEKQSIIAASHLISPTRFLANELNRFLPTSNLSLDIIKNPFQSSGQDVLESKVQKDKVVYYGKLSVQKGSLKLLEYFKELWEEGYTFPLHVVGGTDIVYHIEKRTMGDYVGEKYAKYIQSGLLHFHGKVYPDKAHEHIHDANLVVFPSVVDNLPYAVIEMMSMGKVVLASKSGGQTEIISDGEDGFLFDHDLPGDFRNKLLMVLSLSEEQLRQFGAKAQQTIQRNFDFDAISAQKDSVIKEVLAQSSLLGQKSFPFLHQEPFKLLPECKNDLLSVVIPYYNMGQYIGETLDSVRTSSYKNLEIIIVNDGSADPYSLDVLSRLSGPNLRVLHKKNEGLASARNFGAQAALGSYLAFLDADDVVGQDYYSRAMSVLKAFPNVFFVGTWVRYFGDSKRIWPTFTPQPPYLLVHNPVNSSGLVYKREAFLKSGLNKKELEYGLEDYESVINLVANGFNGIVIPEIHFHYRVRKGSMFRKLNPDKLSYSYKYISEQHELYYNKFATQIFNLLNNNGPGYFFDNPTEEVEVVSRVRKSNRFTYSLISFLKRNPKLKEVALKILRRIK